MYIHVHYMKNQSTNMREDVHVHVTIDDSLVIHQFPSPLITTLSLKYIFSSFNFSPDEVSQEVQQSTDEGVGLSCHYGPCHHQWLSHSSKQITGSKHDRHVQCNTHLHCKLSHRHIHAYRYVQCLLL